MNTSSKSSGTASKQATDKKGDLKKDSKGGN